MAPVLDPGRGCTKTGQLWAYAADDRPWGGCDPPGAVYVYAADRDVRFEPVNGQYERRLRSSPCLPS